MTIRGLSLLLSGLAVITVGFSNPAHAVFEEFVEYPWLHGPQSQYESPLPDFHEGDQSNGPAGADPTSLLQSQIPRVRLREANLETMLQKHNGSTGSLKLFTGTVVKEVVASATSLGLSVFVDYCRNACANWLGMNEGSRGVAATQSASDLFLSQFVLSSVNQSATYIKKQFSDQEGITQERKKAGLIDAHKELMGQSTDFVKSLPQDIQRQVAKLDNYLIQQFSYQSDIDNLIKLLRRRELLLLSLPTEPKNLAQIGKNGDEKVRVAIEEKIQKLVDLYPEANHDFIKAFVQKVRDSSIFKHSERAQAYLYGPPGTGKTTFVRHLAEALDLPLCEISLKNAQDYEIFGFNYDVLTNTYENEKEIQLTGILGKCFIDSGVTNPILFFDEAGEYFSGNGLSSSKDDIKSMLKGLLDPERKTIFLRGIGVQLDFSRTPVIFAGNYLLEDTALRSRLPSLYFGELGIAEKRAAAKAAFSRAIVELTEVLLPEDIEEIQREFDKYLEMIVQEDQKRNPGARIIQGVVMDTLNYVRMRVLNKEPIVADKVQVMIKESLDQRSPILEKVDSAADLES